jgi:hypothetical protein
MGFNVTDSDAEQPKDCRAKRHAKGHATAHRRSSTFWLAMTCGRLSFVSIVWTSCTECYDEGQTQSTLSRVPRF